MHTGQGGLWYVQRTKRRLEVLSFFLKKERDVMYCPSRTFTGSSKVLGSWNFLIGKWWQQVQLVSESQQVVS